jgi:hypothetical protein
MLASRPNYILNYDAFGGHKSWNENDVFFILEFFELTLSPFKSTFASSYPAKLTYILSNLMRRLYVHLLRTADSSSGS